MKITKIAQQIKNRRRYSVYLDEKYSFSLSESQLADSGLHAGQELSKEELTTYKNQSDFGKLYERTLRWLATRARSEWEIDTYLEKIKSQHNSSVSKAGPWKQVKERLVELGLVDDEAFARSWVASRRATKPVSQRKLWVELRQKHIDTDIIETVLAEDETDERDELRKLIERKMHQSQYRDRQKLMAYLARQGFRYDDIKEVLNEFQTP